MADKLWELVTCIEKAQTGMEAAVTLLRQSRDALESCADFLAENGYSNRARDTYQLADRITAALTVGNLRQQNRRTE